MATITEHTLVLVRVRDDEGREGVGEAGIIPHYGPETQHGICQLVDEAIAPCLIGCDPTSLETLIGAMDKQIKGNKYAKGALEMACVDLVARAAGVGEGHGIVVVRRQGSRPRSHPAGPVVNWFLLYFQYDGNEYATLPVKPVVFI